MAAQLLPACRRIGAMLREMEVSRVCQKMADLPKSDKPAADHLACHTQDEIAAEVDCDKATVNRVCCEMADLPKCNKPAADHAVDFETPDRRDAAGDADARRGPQIKFTRCYLDTHPHRPGHREDRLAPLAGDGRA